jgi:hypothetical protein
VTLADPAGALPLEGALPELAAVGWRGRVDETALRRRDRGWTRSVIAHELPFLAAAIGLPLLSPLMIPVSVAALAFAWFIPELYARRGAGVLRPARPRRRPTGAAVTPGAERRALGLLGDLVGHDARAILAETGFAVETGRLGTWVLGPAGALLLRPGGRRVDCWCVRATGEDLPRADRIAHLLLALRADETGFATVANLTFSGAVWRVRRALAAPARAGVDAARALPAGR